MARPEKKINVPAIRWLYFSTGFRLILFSPKLKARTISIIVLIVVRENRIATITAP
jgi:hypothetical protein